MLIERFNKDEVDKIIVEAEFNKRIDADVRGNNKRFLDRMNTIAVSLAQSSESFEEHRRRVEAEFNKRI